ncbi:MAG: MFS transporter [Micropruina sp.]|uniref:MFS transporter n=1 Tax=Micropruina sp. TaxID=2737536 RepID=UPI0039E54509
MLDEMRRLSPAARLLVINQAGVNLGFFMVVPFLAAYLIDDIGMTAAAVGLVLGARTLAQQGLFLPSGVLIDRIGPWPSIVAGCALRVVAFLGLGLAKDPLVALASVLLIGAAGALFQPASRAYLALEATERRAQAFAVFEVWGNAGSLLGPVLGAALLTVDFQVACLVAAGVFGLLTFAQVVVLPRNHRGERKASALVGVRRVLGDRRLALLVVSMSAYLALFNQLYLTLPVEAQRVTGRGDAIAAIYLVFGVLGILLQVRVTAWCGRRGWPGVIAIAAGLGLMGASFVPLALSTAFQPTATAALDLPAALLPVIPLLIATVAFTLGGLMLSPYVIVVLSDYVGDKLIGTAYGWYYLVAAISTMTVAWAAGALLDLGGAPGRVLSFGLLALVGIAGALGVRAQRGAHTMATNRG